MRHADTFSLTVRPWPTDVSSDVLSILFVSETYKGRAMAEVVSHWPFTAQTRAQFQAGVYNFPKIKEPRPNCRVNEGVFKQVKFHSEDPHFCKDMCIETQFCV
jgi:hypothetical protein